MKIQWFGNSTFLLTTDLGKKILLDPFNIFSTLTENITMWQKESNGASYKRRKQNWNM